MICICTGSLAGRGYIRVHLWKDKDWNSSTSMRRTDKDRPRRVLGFRVILGSLDSYGNTISLEDKNKGNKNSTLGDDATLRLQ